MDAIASGYHSFTEIRRNIGEANTKILTDRLGELVEVGVIEKCKTEGTYGLTKLWEELTKKVQKLGEWWAEKEEK
jgi:DNA-binding HxlR family transcriptional regulator